MQIFSGNACVHANIFSLFYKCSQAWGLKFLSTVPPKLKKLTGCCYIMKLFEASYTPTSSPQSTCLKITGEDLQVLKMRVTICSGEEGPWVGWVVSLSDAEEGHPISDSFPELCSWQMWAEQDVFFSVVSRKTCLSFTHFSVAWRLHERPDFYLL